jgi:hypothetical protein
MRDEDREDLRLLRRIASSRRVTPSDSAAMERLVRRGLVRDRDDPALTDLGIAALRRHLSGADGFGAQHQARVTEQIDDVKLGRVTVTVNADESPLSRLRRAKGRDGAALIGAAEFAAGERLRADFTRGQLMPRITSSWSVGIAGRRPGEGGGIAEMSDAIVAARQRVDRALRAVGPDFAGLLLDFCCFLKGIEQIERERAWPVRSAKLVLRLALASLARHYGIAEAATGAARAPMVHWGTEDYRPELAPSP